MKLNKKIVLTSALALALTGGFINKDPNTKAKIKPHLAIEAHAQETTYIRTLSLKVQNKKTKDWLKEASSLEIDGVSYQVLYNGQVNVKSDFPIGKTFGFKLKDQNGNIYAQRTYAFPGNTPTHSDLYLNLDEENKDNRVFDLELFDKKTNNYYDGQSPYEYAFIGDTVYQFKANTWRPTVEDFKGKSGQSYDIEIRTANKKDSKLLAIGSFTLPQEGQLVDAQEINVYLNEPSKDGNKDENTNKNNEEDIKKIKKMIEDLEYKIQGIGFIKERMPESFKLYESQINAATKSAQKAIEDAKAFLASLE